MQALIHLAVFVAILVGSITDIQKREVADWVNYSLIVFGFGANILLSIAFWTWTYVVFSLIGFGVFFIMALIMYYTGQWGGGDSKMLMGIGASIGLPVSLAFPYIDFRSFLVSFWLNLLLAGVVYALIWSIFLAVKNKKKFLKEFKLLLKKNKTARKFVLAGAAILFVAVLLVKNPQSKLFLIVILLFAVITPYLFAFSKAVERAGMLRLVSPTQLTEGDWIAKDVIIKGKKLASPKDLGVSKAQIKQLQKLYSQKKLRTVLIKVGIPFVPSFLAAFIITLAYGNLLVSFLGF